MVDGQQHVQLVLGQGNQRVVLAVLVGLHGQVVDHRHVDLPGAEGAEAFLRLQLQHHHVQPRVSATQRAHGFRDYRHGNRGEGCHAQFTGDFAAQQRQLRARFVEHHENAFGMRHQALAGRGQHHAAPAPFD